MPNSPTFAYLSLGKLYHKTEANKKAQPIESEFANDIRDRMISMQQKHSWKSGSGDLVGRDMLWGLDPSIDGSVQIQLTSAVKLPNNSIGYILETDSIGGYLTQEIDNKEERRRFHKEQFSARDLAIDSKGDQIALSTNYGETMNLATMDADGRNLREITEGDSFDCKPYWYPDEEKLVYQSAGVARNSSGYCVGLGPFSLELLDFDQGDVSTLIESDHFDHLSPKIDQANNLYFIRRPYESPQGSKPGFLNLLKDIVLFPFRLVRAIFDFLNQFSLFFSKKPLKTAGGPPREEMDINKVILQGRLIELEKAAAQGGKDDSLVPKEWELIRRTPDGEESKLINSVSSFDITKDGNLLVCNGKTVSLYDPNGKRIEKLHSDTIIQEVIAL